MHIRRSKRTLGAAIPTASMADIAFLLIIFFMVTTAFSLDRTPMELPQTKEQQQTAKGAAIISITRDGEIRFSAGEEDTRKVVGIPALAAEIRAVTASNRLHPFLIKADRNVPYRVIDQVLMELRGAKAQDVALLSRGEGEP
ncbi:MAG TPA: biopolymer transporter ExbD [Thermoanaerobaculia bacterium]|nr:biopolymer transporter ExbD [Thermoanaerobaculia bacterium]